MEKRISNYASPSVEALELMLENAILEGSGEGSGGASGEIGGDQNEMD